MTSVFIITKFYQTLYKNQTEDSIYFLNIIYKLQKVLKHVFTLTGIKRSFAENLVWAVNSNKLHVDKSVENMLSSLIENKVNDKSAIMFYSLARIFKLSSLSKLSFSYVERWFAIICVTSNFSELDFTHLRDILASSNLNVASELEVFNAAERWLQHDVQQRNKHAKDLLLTVRLSLLSQQTLKHLLRASSAFSNCGECAASLIEVLKCKETCSKKLLKVVETNRYCNNNDFDVLVCGRDRKRNRFLKVLRCDGSNLNYVEDIPFMQDKIKYVRFRFLYLKGTVYALAIEPRTRRKVLKSYSLLTKTWKNHADMTNYREGFSMCGFVDKIFAIGGVRETSCDEYDVTGNQWRRVKGMSQARHFPACAVFQERVVASGGFFRRESLNTVECYDVAADAWQRMPSMIEGRGLHGLVAVKSKLFAIAGSKTSTCEVFDDESNKFVYLKCPVIYNFNQALAVGSKIFVFSEVELHCYDMDERAWVDASEEIEIYCSHRHCAKMP